MDERFGRYRLDGLIGRGGMGEVYRAYDTVRSRTVALKCLPPHLAEDETFRRRFRREAEVAARLTEPHIIPIHDFGEIDGRLFIDMRLIAGTDLGEEIARIGPLPPARAVSIISQVASALAAAHAAHLIHRDVKPSNVLLSTTDRGEDFVHLLDFGIAHNDTGTRLTGTDSVIGTIDYMAPEQFGAGPVDHRVDVYALGCVLYEALTGSKPFAVGGLPAKMQAHLNAPPPRPSDRRADIPPGLDDVVLTAMAKRPQERFWSTTDLAIAAHRALSDQTGSDQTGFKKVGPDAGDTTTRPVTTSVLPGPAAGAPAGVGGPVPGTDRPQPATTIAETPIPPHRAGSVPAAFAGPPVTPGPAAPVSNPGGARPRRGLALAAVAVLILGAAAALLLPRLFGDDSAAPAALPGRTTSETDSATAGTATTSDSTTGASTPAAGAGGTDSDIYVDGTISGQLTSVSVTCDALAGTSWSWRATGDVDGSPADITFTTNNFRGTADYAPSTITDDAGGQATATVGDIVLASDGSTDGVFSVAEDERSGTMDIQFTNFGDDSRLRVSGSWTCG